MKKWIFFAFAAACLLIPQKSLHWIGYGLNAHGRKVGRDIEWLLRPKEKSYLETLFRSLSVVVHFPLTLCNLPMQIFFYSLASVHPAPYPTILDEKSTASSSPFTILSLNTCFHDGFIAPYSGGVAPPFEQLQNKSHRVQALAEWVGKKGDDLFLGQEFHDLRAIYYFVDALKKYGYTFFILDLSAHPILANSGLFVASKRKLADVSFTPFAFSDRAGDDRAARRGVLHFSVLNENDQPFVHILHTHLNSGDEHQTTRNRQIAKYILPYFVYKPTLLIGDLNFDTLQQKSGLEDYRNIFAGIVTRSDEGKISLQGSKEPVIVETLDAMIVNTDQIELKKRKVEPLKIGDEYLTDHFAISASYEQTDP